jgi:hypothetical protein
MHPRSTLRLTSVLSLVLAAILSVPVSSQERIDAEMNWKIRKEGTERSQIMRTMHFLTDVYGPRLTGSPNHKAAAEWAVKQMESWGLTNGHLEPWDFGRPGWLNERLSAHITAPVKDHLVCEALAWTPGTNGPVSASAYQLVLPNRWRSQAADTWPTKEEFEQFAATARAAVKGRIVLVDQPAVVPVQFNPTAKRREDREVRAQYDPNAPTPAGPPQSPPQGPPAPPDPNRLTPAQINEQIDRALLEGGAIARVNDAGREHGQIRAFQNRTYDTTKVVPTVVMRNEDFGRIVRLLADGPVQLEFDIVNRVYPEGRTSYNAIAEIPGTDKKDEVVMLGGHLDSWHAATGATDNAIGSAVMMEAARILQALGVKPRRTIRVALWGGEEQGLLGSKAYVKEHFGTYENPKPEFATFGGYLNIDSGTGRARGASVFGPAEAGQVLREALAPFEDLGVMGASTTNSRRSGGTDSTSFNEAGLPGIGFGQDPIEYGTHTWHTNLDTYERIVEEDVKKSAIAIAAALYHLAMRDQLLPRFSKEQMPPPVTPPPARPTAQ